MSTATLHSMTGYARIQASTELGELSLEIRSVNHRYLEVFLRQPEELRSTEIAVRQRLAKDLGRGKLDVNMRLDGSAKPQAQLEFDEAVLNQLGTAYATLSQKLPSVAALDPLALLRWPGVLKETDVDADTVAAQVMAALDEAIQALCASRAEEGQRLAVMLEERLQAIEANVERVRARLPEQTRRWREKLTERLKDISDMDEERRDNALAQFAQRADVDEELDRLGSHVQAVREVMTKAGPVGRKLDFYMQEFNREANTLGSKSLDAEITAVAVDLKVLIEQMREQVQNVE
nr:YicC family protein [Oceanococcus sp. HetDA_MAG_MS8]